MSLAIHPSLPTMPRHGNAGRPGRPGLPGTHPPTSPKPPTAPRPGSSPTDAAADAGAAIGAGVGASGSGRPSQGADDAKAGGGFFDGGWSKAASTDGGKSEPSSTVDEPKPQTQFEVTAKSMDGTDSKTIPYQVDKDVRDDAPIPDVVSVQYSGVSPTTDPFSAKVSSQVIATGADGTTAATETDSDNTFVDLTDPEVENEVEIDGWKYTFQVEFDGNEASKLRLIDAQPA